MILVKINRWVAPLAIATIISFSSLSDLSADQPSLHRSKPTLDLALRTNGVLVGQAFDQQGRPAANQEIRLTDGRQYWRATTNAEGAFTFAGLSGGVYQVGPLGQLRLVRCWASGTAPPHATHGLLLVESGEVIRGQRNSAPRLNHAVERGKHLLANPWVFGGIVTTAVAIPVALHNADDDDPSSP